MDLYEILGVPRTATATDIKNAWRKLSQKLHPDKKGGDKEQFQRVQSAYEVLSDPDKRQQYDETGAVGVDAGTEQFVSSLVREAFAQAIQAQDATDTLQAAVLHLEQRRAKITVSIAAVKRERAKLLARRSYVLRKDGGRNIYHELVDAEIRKIDSQVDAGQQNIETLAMALQMMGAYQSGQPKRLEEGEPTADTKKLAKLLG